MVDIVLEGDSFDYDVNKLKELSKGNYTNTDFPREGLVFRTKNDWSNTDLNSKFGGKRMSFKIINDDFLLKNK